MITFVNVTKKYKDGSTGLHNLSFEIEKGEFIFLTGSSGAGKTTLLKHIYMELFPTSGHIKVFDFDSASVEPNDIPFLRRKLGIIFQDFKLLLDRNIYDNVAFALRVTGKKETLIKRKVYEVLALTSLSHKASHFPGQLSGGEQQRACFARAIVNDPWLLLADEPTGNLDLESSREIFSLLETINSQGTTVIMSTHDAELIKPYHYRRLVLSQGSLM